MATIFKMNVLQSAGRARVLEWSTDEDLELLLRTNRRQS